MPKLPSSADVRTISPSVSRDPGLTAPVAAFESGVGAAATELSPALEELGRRSIANQERLIAAAEKQQSREDTVESSALTRDLRGEIESLTVDFTSEKDLSLTPDAQEYGAALDGLIQNKLNSFTGSADTRAKLEAKFNNMQGDAIGVASGIGVTVGNEKVLNEIDTEGNTLVTSVSDNPSPQNILGRLSQTKDLIGSFAGAIGTEVELQEKANLDDRIASKGISTQLNAGNIDTAELLLGNPTIFNSLSPASQKTLGNKIQVAQESKRAKIKEVDVLKVIDTSGKLVDSMLGGGSDPKAIKAALTGLMRDANDPNVTIALQGMIEGLPESQEDFLTQKTENEIAADQAIIDRLVEAKVPEDTATLAVLGKAQINVDASRRVEIALTLTKATTLPETAVETIQDLFDDVKQVAEDIRSDLREGRID